MVVATVAVAEEDVTNLTYTAPVWKQMDRGREHDRSKVLILQPAVSKILTTAAGSGAFATFLGFSGDSFLRQGCYATFFAALIAAHRFFAAREIARRPAALIFRFLGFAV